MIDLPLDAVKTPLVHLEVIEVHTIADMLAVADDLSRRHPDWHQDYPREDDCDGVGMVRTPSGWTSRQVRRLSNGLVVGSIGFFGPPEPAEDGVPEVEIGFGLVAYERGRGLMRSAVPAMVQLAGSVGVRVRATTTPDNLPSLATLRGAGFVVRSESDDEVVLVRELAGVRR